MECTKKKLCVLFVVVVLLKESTQETTIRPSKCPTNKIAPHKRIISYDRNRARTFGGAFIDLFANDNPVVVPQNDLQEQPEEDPDDCGEIEDYDETDLSSITPQGTKQPYYYYNRQGRQDNRHHHNYFVFWNRPQYTKPTTTLKPTYQPPTNPPYQPPTYPPYQPPTNPPYQPPTYPPYKPPTNPPYKPPTNPPYRPPTFPTYEPQQPTEAPTAKPPYWAGGIFHQNPYRPPYPEYPSNYVKPVYEHGASESHHQTTYWPGIVGVPLSDIVGASPIIPEERPNTTPPAFTRPTRYPNHPHYDKPRIPYKNSVFESFFDLLFRK